MGWGEDMSSVKEPTGKPSFFLRLRRFFDPIDLTKGNIVKVLIMFTIPIVLSYLLQQIYTLSDAAICGRTLSAQEVAGVNDTFPLTFIFLQFAFGCTSGFTVVTSNKLGENDKEGVRRSFASQIILCSLLTVVITVLSVVSLRPMLGWIHVTPDNPEVYEAAYTYCFIIFLGIFAQLFYNSICCILRSVGDSLTPLVFLLMSTILNIGLDFLFIMAFGWGVAGAAIATVFAQFVSTVGCFVYTFVRYKDMRLSRKDFKVSAEELAQHLKLGIPLGLQFSVLAVGIVFMMGGIVKFDIMPNGIMVEGAPAQNGFGAATKLNNFLMSPLTALGTAVVSFNAQNLGAGDRVRVKKGTNLSLLLMLAVYVIFAGIGLLMTIDGAYQYLFLSPDKISSESIAYGNLFLYADLPLFFIVGTLIVLRGAMQGIGKSVYTLIAGTAELVARIVISVTLPVLVNGAPINALASKASYFALCYADPGAWTLAALTLVIPYIYYILHGNRASICSVLGRRRKEKHA